MKQGLSRDEIADIIHAALSESLADFATSEPTGEPYAVLIGELMGAVVVGVADAIDANNR